MARLHNRIIKADFWVDDDLLRWSRDKRFTYQGIWAIADDSGCLKDSPFQWKRILWASPVDADITIEMLEQWRDELVADDKLVPYSVDGEDYLFITAFHRHEHPRNPAFPDVPLPPWVTWIPISQRRGSYEVDWSSIPGGRTAPAAPPPSRGVPAAEKAAPPAKTKAKSQSVQDMAGWDEFKGAYPNRGGQTDARRKWPRLTNDERMAAIGVALQMQELVADGVQEAKYAPYMSTFINGKRWTDWEDGAPADWQRTEGRNGKGRGAMTAADVYAEAQAAAQRGE